MHLHSLSQMLKNPAGRARALRPEERAMGPFQRPNPVGRSKGSRCEATPDGRTRGVLPVRFTRKGLRPPSETSPQGIVAPAKPALESGTLPRRRPDNGSEIARHSVECSASSAGFARAPDWGRLRRGPSRPPPMKRSRWALFSGLLRLLRREAIVADLRLDIAHHVALELDPHLVPLHIPVPHRGDPAEDPLRLGNEPAAAVD